MGEIKHKCKCCKNEYEPLKRNGIILSRYCVHCLAKRGKKVLKKEAVKEITNYKLKTLSKIQEIARLIDYGQPCPSKKTINCQFHGGHVYARGGHSNISFNLHNIHRQSAQSNHHSSDERGFYEGLKNEYGIEYMEFIDKIERETPIVKLTNNEYYEKYQIACKIANRLRKDKEVYPLNMRILLRNVINNEIGIYDYEYCSFKINESDKKDLMF